VLAGIQAIYTVAVSGGRLAKGDIYRRDGSNLIELVKGALDYYEAGQKTC
jgi:hypothetical protein